MSESNEPERPLTHLTEAGQARMVDVSEKAVTTREAVASAVVTMAPDVLERLLGGDLPKGEALGTARIAGIQAAKRTGEWIPLCHPLGIDWVQVEFTKVSAGVLRVACMARTVARTGVEMEAMVGAAAAALTIYDMAKAADKSIVIGPIQLERKTGGKSGDFRREAS
ncbi:MAG: cyclic pyranopterin monophosphate synthase MoaC [Phycisphaerae bacterium]